MNITKRIKRDIDIYNGVTPETTTSSLLSSSSSALSSSESSSFSIFSNFKMVVILLIVLFIIWYVYKNADLSTKDYKKTMNDIITYIKSLWNKLINMINKGIHSMPSLYGDDSDLDEDDKNKSQKQQKQPTTQEQKSNNTQYTSQQYPNHPGNLKELDTIKTALDTNALTYIATTEESNKKEDDIPGWCYIGKDNSGVGVCFQTNNKNLCESNLFYDKQEQCINHSSDN